MRGEGLLLSGFALFALSACGATRHTDSLGSGGSGTGASPSDGGLAGSGASTGAASGAPDGGSAGRGEGGSGGAGLGGSGDPPTDSRLPLDPVSVDGGSEPNFDCSPPGSAPTSGAVTLSGFVKSWRLEPGSIHVGCDCSALSYIATQVFDPSDLTNPIATGNSGTTGYSLSLPSGGPSLIHLLAQSGQHPTYSMNVRLDPTQASASYDASVVFRVADPGYPSVPSLADLTSAVGVEETEGGAVLIGRVVDCDGRPVEHAAITLSTDATIYYFSVAPNNLPVLPSQRHETDAEGEFFIPEISAPPGPYTLSAWGFLTAADVAAGALALQPISEIELPIPAEATVVAGARPAIVVAEMFPSQGPL
jgi:hypothetical protein